MTQETWFAYALTVLALMITPGPSQIVMLSTSMTHGIGRSIYTAAGDLTANLLQMMAAGFGLAAIVLASRQAFLLVKWAGVAYLLWLGFRLLLAKPGGIDRAAEESVTNSALWWRGFITSAANPKAVVFFAALFPQFLDTNEPLAPQVAVLSATYLLFDACFLSTYGFGAGWLGRRLTGRLETLVNRIGGACIIAAALLLAAKSIGAPG